MNFKLLFSIAALCTFANQIACINPVPTPKIISSPRALRYCKKFDKIHADALNRIKNEFNFTDAEWLSCMNSMARLIKKDTLFATYPLDRSSISANDNWSVQEAKKILIQCGIDPKNIGFDLCEWPMISLCIIQKPKKDKIEHALIINPTWLKELTPQEREYALRHEIMHFAFYDYLEKVFITKLLKKNGHANQEILKKNLAIINYLHQFETRADILAVIDKPGLIKASQNYFENKAQTTKSLSTDVWIIHPSDEMRARNFAQLLVEINQSQLV